MKRVNPFGCALLALACGSSFEPNYNPPALFTNPTVITNAHLPLGTLTQDVLEGVEGGKSSLVIRTRLPGTRAFTVNGAQVLAIIVSDTVYTAGAVTEVALDYFVQSDNGDVYYFGEDVDIYKQGKVVSHEGTWRHRSEGATFGLMMPGRPVVGMKFYQEQAKGVAMDRAEIVSLTDRLTTPAGAFERCLRSKETTPLEKLAHEFKIYAPGVGLVKDGNLELVSHRFVRY